MGDIFRGIIERLAQEVELDDRQKKLNNREKINLYNAMDRLWESLEHIPTERKGRKLTIDGKTQSFCEICTERIELPPSKTIIIWGHCFHHSCFVEKYRDNPNSPLI